MKWGGYLRDEFWVRPEHNLVLKEYCVGGCAIRAVVAPILLTEIMAIRKAIFIERYVSEQLAPVSKGDLVSPFNTRFRSHVGGGNLGCGKRFIKPLSNLFVVGCNSTEYPSIGLGKTDIATRWTLREFRDSPNLFKVNA